MQSSISTKIFNAHQRCGYGDSPFARIYCFLYCRVWKWVGGGSRRWDVLVNGLKTNLKKKRKNCMCSTRIKDAGIAIRHSRGSILFYTSETPCHYHSRPGQVINYLFSSNLLEVSLIRFSFLEDVVTLASLLPSIPPHSFPASFPRLGAASVPTCSCDQSHLLTFSKKLTASVPSS